MAVSGLFFILDDGKQKILGNFIQSATLPISTALFRAGIVTFIFEMIIMRAKLETAEYKQK